jgi:hypothetical protein
VIALLTLVLSPDLSPLRALRRGALALCDMQVPPDGATVRRLSAFGARRSPGKSHDTFTTLDGLPGRIVSHSGKSGVAGALISFAASMTGKGLECPLNC